MPVSSEEGSTLSEAVYQNVKCIAVTSIQYDGSHQTISRPSRSGFKAQTIYWLLYSSKNGSLSAVVPVGKIDALGLRGTELSAPYFEQ